MVEFKQSPLLKKTGKLVVVYTDGACSSNGKKEAKGGVGVYFGDDDPRNYSGPLEGKEQTNNRAEIMAAIIALQRVHIEDDVEIITDSNYLKKAVTEWMDAWEKKGWKRSNKKPVKNLDLFMILNSYIQKKRENNSKVKWTWIKGHSDSIGNQKADKLARLGINKGNEKVSNDTDIPKVEQNKINSFENNIKKSE